MKAAGPANSSPRTFERKERIALDILALLDFSCWRCWHSQAIFFTACVPNSMKSRHTVVA